jgi:hypothetical protein
MRGRTTLLNSVKSEAPSISAASTTCLGRAVMKINIINVANGM